jgi:hypothetical protein
MRSRLIIDVELDRHGQVELSATLRLARGSGRPSDQRRARERTRDHMEAAREAVDRLAAIDLRPPDSFAARANRRKASVERTNGRLLRWRVTRGFNIAHLYEGGVSLHITEASARRKAARWLAKDPQVNAPGAASA